MHLLRAISSGLAVLVCLCGSGAVVAQDDTLDDSLRLEAQPLSEALIDFSEQTGLQIGYATELAEGKMGQAVEDIAEPRAALAALLKNSGLEYQFVNEGTVVIRAAAARAGAGKAATREKRSPSVEPLLMAQLQPEGEQGGNDEDDEDAGDEAQSEETDPLALGELRITGSRLIRGDPTARVITITAAQIKAMGVSNVEELVRTLPWAYPSNTTQTTAQPADSASSDSGDRGFGALALGISTINLRALGSQNTLVLLNGRRLAGVAGKQPNIANILSLPLSAIERVEIQLDGGSAVYGADAIGGLINFITKKDYQGLSSTVRHEFSATNSDRTQVDLHGGYAWGSGSVSGTLSRNRSRAIEHSTFWTTRDYREQFGPEYDLRFTRGQPGTVCRWNGSYFFVWCAGGSRFYRRLPEEHSGVDATPEDFLHYPDGWPWLTDFVRPQNGEDSTHDSLTLRVEQSITRNLELFVEVLASDLYSYRQTDTIMTNYLIPASNAYNPYDHTVVVNYIPVRELKSGLIPHAYNEADNKQRNYLAGFFWEVRENHQIEFTVTRSESKTLATLLRPDFRRSFDDPSADRFYAAVDSSDPAVALNLFGNGTAQSPGFVEIFTHPLGRTRGSTVVRAFEPVARGALFQLWGGPVTYAVGAVFRDEVYAEYDEEYRNKEFVGMSSKTANYGVEQPKEENTAYFGEFAVPLVDRNNARPGLHSLVLSLQARRDTHSAVGGIGGLSSGREPFVFRFYVPGEGWRAVNAARRITVGTPELIDDKKTRTSKRLGLLYKPTENLALRTSWSGSYKPPGYGVRFNPFGDYRLSIVVADDPYHPDAISSRQFYPLWNVGYQSHLRPEIGDTYSVSLNWTPDAIPGLLWQVAWSRVDFTDRIIGGHIVRSRFPRIGYAMPELVNRDDAGYITRINRAYVNLSRDVSETLDARIEYSFTTRLGRFTPALRYNRVLQEYLQITPDADRASVLGKGWGSNRYRIQGSLNWRWGRFEADVFASYVPSYESRIGSARCLRYVGRCVRPNQPLPPTIAKSLTTVDLTVSYQFDMGLRLRAGGRNIFYAKPHVIWYGYPYDATRWDARGRVLFMEVNWEI